MRFCALVLAATLALPGTVLADRLSAGATPLTTASALAAVQERLDHVASYDAAYRGYMDCGCTRETFKLQLNGRRGAPPHSSNDNVHAFDPLHPLAADPVRGAFEYLGEKHGAHVFRRTWKDATVSARGMGGARPNELREVIACGGADGFPVYWAMYHDSAKVDSLTLTERRVVSDAPAGRSAASGTRTGTAPGTPGAAH